MSTDADDTADYPPEHGSPLVSASRMTLRQAVDILNRERHRSDGQWTGHLRSGDGSFVRTPDDGNEIPAWEAIAIAQRYERECG